MFDNKEHTVYTKGDGYVVLADGESNGIGIYLTKTAVVMGIHRGEPFKTADGSEIEGTKQTHDSCLAQVKTVAVYLQEKGF